MVEEMLRATRSSVGKKRDEMEEGYEGACSLIDKGQGLRPCRELDSRLRLFSAETIHALRPWSLEFQLLEFVLTVDRIFSFQLSNNFSFCRACDIFRAIYNDRKNYCFKIYLIIRAYIFR